jgi:predicted SprT family Zn-dependent metalloprotease
MEPYITFAKARRIASTSLNNAWERAEAYLISGMDKPLLKWAAIDFKTVGEARWRENSITLNQNCLYSENFEEHIDSIVTHELCHLIARRFGARHHDAVFKKICRKFGNNGKAHSEVYAPDNADGTVYKCTCGNRLVFHGKKALEEVHKGLYFCWKCKENVLNAQLIKQE